MMLIEFYDFKASKYDLVIIVKDNYLNKGYKDCKKELESLINRL